MGSENLASLCLVTVPWSQATLPCNLEGPPPWWAGRLCPLSAISAKASCAQIPGPCCSPSGPGHVHPAPGCSASPSLCFRELTSFPPWGYPHGTDSATRAPETPGRTSRFSSWGLGAPSAWGFNTSKGGLLEPLFCGHHSLLSYSLQGHGLTLLRPLSPHLSPLGSCYRTSPRHAVGLRWGKALRMQAGVSFSLGLGQPCHWPLLHRAGPLPPLCPVRALPPPPLILYLVWALDSMSLCGHMKTQADWREAAISQLPLRPWEPCREHSAPAPSPTTQCSSSMAQER